MVATAMDNEQETCVYVSVKIDADILPLAKAAASLDKQAVQDWLSDVANQAASSRLKQKPLKRKHHRKDK